MKTQALLGAILLITTGLFAADTSSNSGTANVAGKWGSEFDTRVGHLKYVYDLKVSGNKLTGTATRERDGNKTEIELKEGTVNGDEVSFVEPLQMQDRDVRIEYKGKLSGDDLKLTRKVGDFATTEVVAHRLKDTAVSVDGKWNAEFDSGIGKQTYTYELKTDGEKLTGKAIGESQFGKFETPITEGKVSPTGISFVEMLKLPEREIRIEYTGKLSGGELKLTRKVADIATEEFAAKRASDSKEK